MTPQEYGRLREMFFKALETPVNLRLGRLEQIRQSDPDLFHQVQRLLQNEEEATAYLREPLFHIEMSERLTALLNGDKQPGPEVIGPYRVIRKLGDGGMGTVYEAQQEKPRRKVALKVIRPDAVTESTLRRFEYEAHLLGRMKHPGIAQIHEFGVASIGEGLRPYFAMELVEGERLDEYAASRRLETSALLELFVRICDAVHHAHQRGVIHRDLKPANVLVEQLEPSTAEGGSRLREAQPRILDFGIARSMDSELGVGTFATRIGQPVGTLAYMSPEQATGDWDEVDARSDVYSLGVMLHELLTGCPPYRVDDKPLHEAVRIIHEEIPVRLGQSNRKFRGDLETVAAKALHKAKSQRYQSAFDLASDLRSVLKREPIMARSPSTMSQLRHFSRRHPALVTGVCVALLTLSFGIAMTAWQAVRATRAQAKAMAAQAKAVANQARADDINGFLLDAIRNANGWGRGRNLTVWEMTDVAIETMPERLAGQEEVQAGVLRSLGMALYHLGEYEAAEQRLRESLLLHERLFPEDDPATYSCMNDLGQALSALGRYAEAETLHRRAYEARRHFLGEEDRATLMSMNALAVALYEQRPNAQKEKLAEELLRTCLETRRRTLGADDAGTIDSMANLAGYLHIFGHDAEAEDGEAEGLFRQVAENRMRVLGAEHPEALLARQNLAVHLAATGKHEEAARILREVHPSCLKILGEDHPYTARAAQKLGWMLRDQGELNEAQALLESALRVHRARLGDAHSDTLQTMNSLVLLLAARGRFADAEALALEALAFREKHFGSEHEMTLFLHSNLGFVYGKQERWDAALPCFEKSYAGHSAKYGEHHASTIRIGVNLAKTLNALDRSAEAERLLESSMQHVLERHGEDHFETAFVASGYCAALLKLGKLDEAEALYRRIVDVLPQATLKDRTLRAGLLCDYGVCLMTLERFEQAEDRLLHSIQAMRELSVPEHSKLAQAIKHVDELYEVWGRPERAMEFHRGLGQRTSNRPNMPEVSDVAALASPPS